MCAMPKPEDYYPKSQKGQYHGRHQRKKSPRGSGDSHGRRGGGGRQQGGGGGQEWPPSFKDEKVVFRENGHIRESLLTTDAESYAAKFLEPSQQQPLTSAQLRRFYNEVKALEAKIEASGFEANAPLVKMLRSKVAYACPQQGNQKIPKSFATFLWKHIEHIRSKQDFEDFCLMFEAVVGFFYGKGGR